MFTEKLAQTEFGRGLLRGPLTTLTATLLKTVVSEGHIDRHRLPSLAKESGLPVTKLAQRLHILHMRGFLYSVKDEGWSLEAFTLSSFIHHWSVSPPVLITGDINPEAGIMSIIFSTGIGGSANYHSRTWKH